MSKNIKLKNKHIKRQKSNSLREIRAKQRRQSYLRKKRNRLIGVSELSIKNSKIKEQYEEINFPLEFSFIENTAQCIEAIEKIQNCLKIKKRVSLKLKNVQKITDDAIVVLMSIIREFQLANIDLVADKPVSEDVCKKIEQSGIKNHVGGSVTVSKSVNRNGIYCSYSKKVQPKLSHNLIGQAAETIWGKKFSCPKVQRVLIECMANTHAHANPQKNEHHSWWLSISHDEENKRVSFSFVDYGIGICESIGRQKDNARFKILFNKVLGKYKTNAEIFKSIMEGELRESRKGTGTGEKNRGNGLPSILTAMKKNDIANVKIITNNVFADLFNNNYVLIDKQFRGTFVYWELNEHCFKKNWV